jgi:FkbM family methyltransferase
VEHSQAGVGSLEPISEPAALLLTGAGLVALGASAGAERTEGSMFSRHARQSTRVPGLAGLLRICLVRGVRGSTRMTFGLARYMRSLQQVPIRVGSSTVHIDLRDPQAHVLLMRAPWPETPCEPDEQAIMRRIIRPGDIVLDIGAHIGLHTTLLSQLVGPSGRVHAFEANPRRGPALARTIEHCPNATLHLFGLGSDEEVATLFVPAEDDAMASLTDWTLGEAGAVSRTTCTLRTLDRLTESGLVPHADFMKCDVEGAELQVFNGARLTLDRADAPCVMYEANARSARAFASSTAAATQWLAALERPAFQFFHVQPHAALLPVSPELHTRDDHFNLLAVPAARMERLAEGGLIVRPFPDPDGR